MKYANKSVKTIVRAKKIILGIRAHTCICENGKYLNNIADALVSVSNELINAADNILTNITNTISTNVMSTVSINSDDKKAKYKMDCYILFRILLVIILLLIIAIICHHYTKHKSTQKPISALIV